MEVSHETPLLVPFHPTLHVSPFMKWPKQANGQGQKAG